MTVAEKTSVNYAAGTVGLLNAEMLTVPRRSKKNVESMTAEVKKGNESSFRPPLCTYRQLKYVFGIQI